MAKQIVSTFRSSTIDVSLLDFAGKPRERKVELRETTRWVIAQVEQATRSRGTCVTWNLNASEQSMSDFNSLVTVANEETLAIFPAIPYK
jgi:hypothetical protein